MKSLKKESGITLIALIITIIILVILAAVSIRAVTNMKIVDYAMNGSQNYAVAGKAENKMLEDTVSFIDEAVAKVEAASGKTDLEKLEEYFIMKIDIWGNEPDTYANKEPIMDASTSIEDVVYVDESMDRMIIYNNTYYNLTFECYDVTNDLWWVTKVEKAKEVIFTIDGTEYTAVEGMDWGAWLASRYNTGNFYGRGGFVTNEEANQEGKMICKPNGRPVRVIDIIDNSVPYTLTFYAM